jgi:integrase
MYLSNRPAVRDNRPNQSPMKSGQTLAIRKASETEADFVPHLRIEEVQELSRQAEATARAGKGERDSLLTLFDGCFRVSEALRLTPESLVQTPYGWIARIRGKGSKVAEVAISSSLASKLLAYAYNKGIKRQERLFPVSSTRVWQIVDRGFQKAGIRKPEHVGTVHVLRHSGAIARLAATGNPKAVQDQLRHKEAKMTLRYLKTLSSLESLKIQQKVDFEW